MNKANKTAKENHCPICGAPGEGACWGCMPLDTEGIAAGGTKKIVNAENAYDGFVCGECGQYRDGAWCCGTINQRVK